jgi:hypothetical protein
VSAVVVNTPKGERSGPDSSFTVPAAFCPDKRTALVVDEKRQLRLLDLTFGREAWSAPVAGYPPSSDFCFVAKNKQALLATYSPFRGGARVCCRWYDLATGKVVRQRTVALKGLSLWGLLPPCPDGSGDVDPLGPDH